MIMQEHQPLQDDTASSEILDEKLDSISGGVSSTLLL